MPRRCARRNPGYGECGPVTYGSGSRGGEEAEMFVRIGKLSLLALGAMATGALALAPARAEDTFKIGLILPMTGGQASTGKQIDNAIKLYMKQHGDTVAGKKVEVILKDDGALPDETKTAAQ